MDILYVIKMNDQIKMSIGPQKFKRLGGMDNQMGAKWPEHSKIPRNFLLYYIFHFVFCFL
jgi:hypothetical protein